MKNQYQLVLQFVLEIETELDLDRLHDLERELAILLRQEKNVTVDGHDFGSGEANIFIFTDCPEKTLNVVFPLVKERVDDFKAAYRDIQGENYVVLWPQNETEFLIS